MLKQSFLFRCKILKHSLFLGVIELLTESCNSIEAKKKDQTTGLFVLIGIF